MKVHFAVMQLRFWRNAINEEQYTHSFRGSHVAPWASTVRWCVRGSRKNIPKFQLLGDFYPEGSGGRTHWPRGSGRTRPNFYPAASEPWPQSEGVARIIGFSWRVQEHWQEGRCHLIFLDHFGPCRVPSQVHGRSPITDDFSLVNQAITWSLEVACCWRSRI